MMEVAITHESESEHERSLEHVTLNRMVTGALVDMELDPEPIFDKWILSGNPAARSKTLALSHDGASRTVVWDCTAGSFYWHYRQDESVLVLSGDAYLLEENGKEHRFAAGDFGFFPAGTVVKWRVDKHIRKIAFLREPMWRPFVPVLMLWNKIMRKLGRAPHTRWTHISAQR